MITNYKFLLLILIISFLACENETWNVPVGYQNHSISLGDSYQEVDEKIGQLQLDIDADNSDDFKYYLKCCYAINRSESEWF